MNIEIKLFYDLAQFLPSGSKNSTALIPLDNGASVQVLMDSLRLPPEGYKNILVNGLKASGETRLKENDSVAIFPPMAGG